MRTEPNHELLSSHAESLLYTSEVLWHTERLAVQMYLHRRQCLSSFLCKYAIIKFQHMCCFCLKNFWSFCATNFWSFCALHCVHNFLFASTFAFLLFEGLCFRQMYRLGALPSISIVIDLVWAFVVLYHNCIGRVISQPASPRLVDCSTASSDVEELMIYLGPSRYDGITFSIKLKLHDTHNEEFRREEKFCC